MLENGSVFFFTIPLSPHAWLTNIYRFLKSHISNFKTPLVSKSNIEEYNRWTRFYDAEYTSHLDIDFCFCFQMDERIFFQWVLKQIFVGQSSRVISSMDLEIGMKRVRGWDTPSNKKKRRVREKEIENWKQVLKKLKIEKFVKKRRKLKNEVHKNVNELYLR